MADIRKHSSTSNLMRFTLKHATTGVGLTGLSSASAGLIISTIADNEATATIYTVAGSTIETITTLGTYAAPTATKCRFKEVDATNHKGLYEFQFADARFSVASAKRLIISVTGATSLLDADYEIQLVQFDPYDSVRMGMTALPNAAAEAAGGLYTRGTGAGQIAQDANGNIRANVDTIKTQAVTCAAGVTVLASVGTAATSMAQTGDTYALANGANGFVAIKGDTAAILTDTGTDGVVVAAASKTGYALSSTGLDAVLYTATGAVALARAVWSDTLSGATYTDGMAGKRLKGISAVPFVEGTVNDASATTTSFVTNLTGYANGHFEDALCFVELSADVWEARPIITYNGTTGAVTLEEALTAAPANGVSIAIYITHVHPSAQIVDAVWDEALSGHTTAGTAGKTLSDILTDTAEIGTAGAGLTALASAANLATAMSYIDTEVVAIYNIVAHATYGNAALNTKLGSPAVTIAADIASIKVDTGTTIINHLTGIKGATFDTATDSLEALRNRGDSAWTTAAGFSTHTAADVWAVGARALTDKAGFSLSAAGVDAILDEVVEGSSTLRQLIRIMAAVLAGKSAGGGTAEIIFTGIDGTTARVTATVDANGNRTAMTLNGA